MKDVPAFLTPIRDGAAVIALVVVWQVVTVAFSVPAFLLPQPSVIAQAFVANASRIGAGLAQTGIEAAFGFIGGNALGLALALVFARWGVLARIGMPFAIALRSVPCSICTIPAWNARAAC